MGEKDGREGIIQPIRDTLEDSPLWKTLTPEEKTAMLLYYGSKFNGKSNAKK